MPLAPLPCRDTFDLLLSAAFRDGVAGRGRLRGVPFAVVIMAGEFFDGVRKEVDVPAGFLGVFGAEVVVVFDAEV